MKALRRMIRETSLSVNDLILPLFVIDGQDVKNPIFIDARSFSTVD